MPKRRGALRLGYTLIAAVIAVGALAAGTIVAQADTSKNPDDVAQTGMNQNPDRLVVYDNNLENMVPCGDNDYTKLIDYMKKQPKSPDIFTVQQISNTKQLKKLTTELTKKLPGKFAGKIAIGDPGSMGYTEGCKVKKNQQTNATIYRVGRLSVENTTTWRSDAPNADGKCRNLTPTATSQDRVENVAARFYDKVAKARVSVASIHWPTKKWDGPKCADENMREADKALANLGGSSMKIFAGDANATTPKQDWWKKARGYGYIDPIAEKCNARVCPDRYDTIGKSRIDHIMVKSGHGFSHVENITPGMAGGKYSDHRAITTYAKY